MKRWTITTMTIPSRERYAATLLKSLAACGADRDAELQVVYNWDTPEPPSEVESRLRKLVGRIPFSVTFNTASPTIGSGRALQLSSCKTPLVCFVDDDVTVHGRFIRTLEDEMRRLPLGVVGLPSLVGATETSFKPRDSTPHVDRFGVRFMPVQGMLVAGYRRLFLDIGGFNPRRRFWGEWTELNLRLWRSGFPSAYAPGGAYLRHWEDAPQSPTRNMDGRHLHVLWGLMCTAIEYEAESFTPMTDSFWHLVRTRYLPYSFGEQLSPDTVLAAALQLAPELSAEWPRLRAFREHVSRLPFSFAPFHDFTTDDVDAVLASAESRIEAYRGQLFSARGFWSRLWARRPRRRRPTAVSPRVETPRTLARL
ncbi:MAG: glycosyltransferase family 2 protein [Gemmatimonadota bacterium]